MKSIFTCLLVSMALFGFAQQNTFKVRVYTPDYSYLNQLIQLNDGSFVGVGVGFPDPNNSNASVYILKTDAAGKLLASKALNIDDDDYSTALVKTSDGGFAICGEFGYQVGLIKFAADLTIQWQKNYTTTNDYSGILKLVQAADGGYMMAGGVLDDNTFGYAALVIKTDSQGQVQFSKSYFDFDENVFYDVVATTDGNYALLGVSSFNSGPDTIRLVKINSTGSVIWARKFSNRGNIVEDLSCAATPDGGIIISGDTYIPDTDVDDYQLMMVKYSNAGNLLWSKHIITPDYSEIYAGLVTVDRDGGYLFCGEIDTYTDEAENNYDTSYGYIAKTNASGDLLWTKTFEPSYDGYTYFAKVITTADGGYAACGNGYFYNAEEEDDASLIYKFNGNLIACSEPIGSVGTSRSFGTSASEMVSTANVTFSGSDISASLVDFGTIDNVCSSSAFPLQLLSFNASLQNKSVTVNWTTANEINTNYFVVERSANGASFTALQKIAAKGNSSVTQTYVTTDLQPLQGTSYYRLQQVDKDGKTTYSSVAQVTVLSNGTIVISPNPVQSVIRVVVQSSVSSNLTLQVVDMKGAVLATQKRAIGEGRNEILIAAASLAKGVYILKVMEKDSVQTIRFVKE